MLFVTVSLMLMLLLLFNCKKESLKVAPTVAILEATNVTSNSAAVSSTITADGGSEVLSRGVVWSTSDNPTTSDYITSDGKGLGSYASSLTSLNPGTTYNLKSYATNAIGTAYSSQISFKTLALLPVISTSDLSSVTSSSVDCGGNITNDGGSPVMARGVCWSANQNPTTSDSKTSDGSGSGLFKSSITGLIPGTTYYVRAYSTNSIGTAYGNQLTVVTMAVLPTLTTTELTLVTSATAVSGGNITNDGGATVTARGVCWSTKQTPTIADGKSTDGTGAGVYTSAITGLTPGTIYYVRAYAINSIGTAYGNQVTATTTAILSTITTTDLSLVTATSATGGGNITNDGGAAITARGVCWGTSQTPTTANSKTTDGTGTGSFTSAITGLTPGTQYYFRAYAINSIGTAYGNQITATTPIALPTLTTISATAIGSFAATVGGSISSNGGGIISEKGIFWGTIDNPETNGTRVKSNSTTSDFSMDLSDLLPGTTYYVKAYATNSKGTNYGNLVSFKSSDFKIGIIDVSQSTPWNYWVVGKDGSSYFVAMKNNKPVTAYYKPDKNKEGCIIYFDDRGLPSRMVIDNNVFLYSNYRNQLVDIAVVTSNNAISVQRNVTVSTDLSKFLNKSATSDLLFGLGLTSDAIGIASCIGGVIAVSSGIGALPGAILVTGCASTIVGLAVEIFPENFQASGTSGKIVGYVSGVAGCAIGSVSDCVITTAGFALDLANGVNDRLNDPNVSVAGTILAQGFNVSTSNVNSFTSISAVVGGSVVIDGIATITEKGVFYGTTPNPKDAGQKFAIGTGSGNFTSSLFGLTPNTTYYVTAYATSPVTTLYGPTVSFKTSAQVQLPTLTTSAITSITTNSAMGGGNVTSDGGAISITEGICWSTSPGPTIANSVYSNGLSVGTGSYASLLSGLNPGTTYYVRAYATNTAGTAYGNQILFTTSNSVPNNTVADVDGNIYSTVTIGTQVWMAENLKTTHYSDGTSIPLVTDNNVWGSLETPAYCWFNNDGATYKTPYGALYNWYTVNTAKVCPIGWHVPTDTEWTTLTTFLGGISVAGGKLKEAGTVHWSSPNTGATNISGFTAIPMSMRAGGNGLFDSIIYQSPFWSSSEYSSIYAWLRSCNYNNSEVLVGWGGKGYGLSVRCLKN